MWKQINLVGKKGEPMKLMILITFLVASSVYAQTFSKSGTATVVRLEVAGTNTSASETLVISGDAAKAIYDGMHDVSTDTSGQTCSNGAGARVNYRVGKSFTCEKWPSECYGQVLFMCKAGLEISSGEVKAH
jgi:hypothetical protein